MYYVYTALRHYNIFGVFTEVIVGVNKYRLKEQEEVDVLCIDHSLVKPVYKWSVYRRDNWCKQVQTKGTRRGGCIMYRT